MLGNFIFLESLTVRPIIFVFIRVTTVEIAGDWVTNMHQYCLRFCRRNFSLTPFQYCSEVFIGSISNEDNIECTGEQPGISRLNIHY